MANSNKRKDNRFTYKMQGRLTKVFCLTCVFFAVLIGRIIYIQMKSGAKYEKIVLKQQEYSSKTIPYQRGNILDSQGTALASSVDVYNIILDCKELNKHQKLQKSTMEIVEKCFPEVDMADFKKRMKENKNSRYQVLAKKVSYDEKAAFDEECKKRKSDKIKFNECIGIWTEKEYVRQYPYGSLAASVIGFTASGNKGLTGLELYYNKQLNGVNGRSYGFVSDSSSVEGTVVDAKSGNSIKTSIDHNIQRIAETAVLNRNNEYVDDTHKTGTLSTSVVVMNPNTGEILALVDYPSFDLNNPRDLSHLYSEEQLNSMSDEDKSKVLNSLWNSKVVTNTFEPGSTFKPMTVACGLDTGKIKGDESYYCTGSLEVGVHNIHCAKNDGHGAEDVQGSIRDSCNVCLMQMGMAIGAKDFSRYQRLFGYGLKTGIDLPGEANTSGLLYGEDLLQKDVNIATNAFGQNFNVTRIQMATAFCSIINGGSLYKPHLVTSIQDSDGNVIEKIKPVLMKKTISEDTSKTLRSYLRSVVTDGTGKAAAVEGYDIGGKTGTAEKHPRSEKNYVLSFEGFCPVDDPQIMVYVTCDTVNSPIQYHDNIAKNIFHDIMVQILPYLNIQPSQP